VRAKILADCAFCSLPPERIWIQTEGTIAFRDAYPLSNGHTLVIPRRHVYSLFDLPEEEQQRRWCQVSVVHRLLREAFKPSGFNVGLNDGQAAGQTVFHAHVHIIPRYSGDVTDPRGGVRWVIPTKARYWSE
jgi:diadenosine tetraphosphate (Ap4A) HIT family hydrolase